MQENSVWNQGLLDGHMGMSAEILWANRVRNGLFTFPEEKWIKKPTLPGSGLHLPDACVLDYNIFLFAFSRNRHFLLPLFYPASACFHPGALFVLTTVQFVVALGVQMLL